MALEDAKHQVDEAFTNPDQLKGLSNENTFGGATSFLRRLYTKDLKGVDIAVTGVPFDQAVTNRPGHAAGPAGDPRGQRAAIAGCALWLAIRRAERTCDRRLWRHGL